MAREIPYISKLDTKVQVYGLTETRNALLEAISERVLLCDTYAAVNDISGSRQADDQIRMVSGRSYIIRKRDGIVGGKDLRLKDGDALYIIDSVRKIGRTHLEIFCTSFSEDYGAGDNGGGDGGDGGTTLEILNEEQGNYASAGFPYSLQILTNGQPTSYGALNLPAGLSINTDTGLISGTLNDFVGPRSFVLQASDANGMVQKMVFLTTVGYDISVMRNPYNVYADGFNPPDMGYSFVLNWTTYRYISPIERIEFYLNDTFDRALIDNVTGDLGYGGTPTGLLIQSSLIQPNVPINAKLRIKYYNGNWTDFTENIAVIVPPI